MTLEELVTKVKSLEEQVFNLATRQSNRSADADSGISEAKAKTEEVKREIKASVDDMDLQIAMVQVDTEFLMCLEELNEEGGE